jgi:type II protein arginine methyltransferase
MTRKIPSDNQVERWCGENIKLVVIDKELFLTNKKGFPVLSKGHQRIIRKFMTYKIKIALKGNNYHNNELNKYGGEVVHCN